MSFVKFGVGQSLGQVQVKTDPQTKTEDRVKVPSTPKKSDKKESAKPADSK